jgi:hypothetical protein
VALIFFFLRSWTSLVSQWVFELKGLESGKQSKQGLRDDRFLVDL